MPEPPVSTFEPTR